MTSDIVISETAPWSGLRTAAIASPAFSDARAGEASLLAAEAEARRRGFEAIVGPMAGDTWGSYRVAIWSDGSPGFYGEPPTGPFDLEAYLAAGFAIVETHSSAVAAPGPRGFASVGSSDVTISSWDGRDSEALLAEAHTVVMAAFARTPFFRPIPLECFVASYGQALVKADPRFVLAARDRDSRAVGFTLAYPDPMRKGAVILKTYASLLPGVGRRMADTVHATAAEAGFSEVVHALMRDGIASASQSREFGGRPIRRYALMGKRL